MTAAGFDLSLSRPQQAAMDALHSAVPELRAAAAAVESDGIDLSVLSRLLESAGVSPSTLLDGDPPESHTVIIAVEELAYADAASAWAAVPALQIAIVVNACATDDQRRTVRRVLAQESFPRARVLMYEDFGRQPSEYQSRLRSTPDGGIAVDGRKSSVTYPRAADITLLVGRDGDELVAACYQGDPFPLTVERDDDQLGKVAITALPTGAVSLTGVSLSSADRLAGGIDLHRAIGQARLLLAATLLGLSRATLEFCAAYATMRTTWGQPLAQYQGVSFPLIEHTTELEEVRLLVWDVAARLTRLDDVDDIERQVARAVNRASSLALRSTRHGVQLIGVRGITRDLPSERWYRQAAVLAAIDFDILHTPFGLS